MAQYENVIEILGVEFNPEELSNLSMNQLEEIQCKLDEIITKVDELREGVEV